jgi:hypothetical protein
LSIKKLALEKKVLAQRCNAIGQVVFASKECLVLFGAEAQGQGSR